METVQKVAAETDPAKRKEYNFALADYLWEQQLKIGIVAPSIRFGIQPERDRVMEYATPGPQAPYTSPELIVPAR